MRKIYHTRCREIFLKCNFPSSFSDKQCVSLCSEGQDRESHIYLCKYFSNQSEIVIRNIAFEEIFGNVVENQVNVVDILYSRLEVRKTFLSPASPNGVPHDPRRGQSQAPPRLGVREAKQKHTLLKKNKTRGIKI